MMEREIIERFDKGHEIFFGFKKDDNLIGYVSLKPFFPGYNHCEIYWLAVDAENQGKGIGSTLVAFIESYAKEKGFRKIFLYTGKNMTRTRSFYERLGYEFVNEFPDYYGFPSGLNTAILYGKELRVRS